MSEVKKSVSNHQFKSMKFKTLELPEHWRDTFGDMEVGFSMSIWGKTGEGKTTLMLRFLKDLSQLGKVYYNSHEQGMVGSLQKQASTQGIFDLTGNEWIWGDRDTLADMRVKLKTNRAKFVVIDSRDSLKLTKHDFLDLKNEFPKKSFIVICWCSGDKANGKEGQGIAYMSDVKVYIKDHQTNVRSRYGITKPYKIFDKQKESQGSLF